MTLLERAAVAAVWGAAAGLARNMIVWARSSRRTRFCWWKAGRRALEGALAGAAAALGLAGFAEGA